MAKPLSAPPPRADPGADPLDALLVDHVMTLDLVSAFAGDRPMTEFEARLLADLQQHRADELHPALLHTITHERFPSTIAEGLWDAILKHKVELSAAVGRNVGIAVAALDYLSNLKGQMQSPKLIGESHAADIARLALHDGLTRLFNHTTCLEKIAVELRIHQRYGRAASLLMMDVDNFKSINDQHGHQAGDRVLAELGALFDATTRDSDICCRYGGEEFAVILPATGAKEAELLAERLRAKAESARPGGRQVTVSIGVASCGPDTRTAQSLVELADAAMYRAKQNGKNRVEACRLQKETP